MIEDEEDGVTSSLPDRHRTFRKASSKFHLTNRLDTLAKHDVDSDIRTSLKSSHEADTESQIINKKIKVCVDVAYVKIGGSTLQSFAFDISNLVR